jgi:hypothetical protein
MKNLATLFLILLAGLFWLSCNKLKNDTGKESTQVTLIGDWQVVNDTSTNTPWGIWAGKPVVGVNYLGTPSDHFKFTADGHLYNQLQGATDTSTYKVSHDSISAVYTYFNGQVISNGVYHTTWTVSNLTLHTLTLSTWFTTPETAITQVINLKR